MKKQVLQISVLQAAKVAAAIHFVIGIPAAMLVGWATSVMLGKQLSILMLMPLPFVYALAGFAIGAIGCLIYNLIASQIGGFEYTTEEVSAATM